jgi:hypothetical protein
VHLGACLGILERRHEVNARARGQRLVLASGCGADECCEPRQRNPRLVANAHRAADRRQGFGDLCIVRRERGGALDGRKRASEVAGIPREQGVRVQRFRVARRAR